MNLDDYIQYWAQLIRESYGDNSQLFEMSSKQNQQKPKNHSSLNDQQIQTNVSRALQKLMRTTRINHFLFAFKEDKPKSIVFMRNKRRFQVCLKFGNRNFGVIKIARKHLIDGQNAQTGGFTLAEFNRDLPDIIQNAELKIENRNTISFNLNKLNGLSWKIVAFKEGNLWVVNTIYTSRNQTETKQMVQQLKK